MKEYLAELAKLQGKAVAYVDETGMDTWLYREHGWSARGVPLIGKVGGRRYERTGVVAALMGKSVVEPYQYGGIMDSQFFEEWFAEKLLPALPAGTAIVMDNAAFHRKSKLRPLAEAAGHAMLFLPPYSPELNPIENFWAWLKRRIRKILPQFQTFGEALCYAFEGR